MVSLASYRTVFITAIDLAEGRQDLRGIAKVQFEGDHSGAEESSVEDFIRWLDAGEGRAYVRRPDEVRGPQVYVVGGRAQRYIRSGPDAEEHDALLTLPRLRAATPPRRIPAHRRVIRRIGQFGKAVTEPRSDS